MSNLINMVILMATLFRIPTNVPFTFGTYSKHQSIISEITNFWSGNVEKKGWYQYESLERTFNRLPDPNILTGEIAIIVKNTNDIANLNILVRAWKSNIIDWANNQPSSTQVFLLTKSQYQLLKFQHDSYRGVCFRYSKNTLNMFYYDNNFLIQTPIELPTEQVGGFGVVNSGGRIPPR